ncbi:hypothetical protein CONPUDRAFT_162124 [Coniophora puteana RWD-64-598 SS2]|uniref:WD40 repeat-like protein n=1 Tax=Coniophora puteana (strain RWD-64-598) TaxID=741705 RepID=A0A5M3N030_CONPW|nr:uncharacterized protein CONPUDRAFT_162124 [Coniophora puteana RWD-64-598 SS2]EIW84773.1 hypothetical protein CONPUDRAFT_162124 [Coniophora puteana RWD-64-598 SS2]
MANASTPSPATHLSLASRAYLSFTSSLRPQAPTSTSRTQTRHNDPQVLSGSDGVLRMWSVRDGTAVQDLPTGQMGVWQVAFSGRWCVAASNRDNQTMLYAWDFGVDGDEAHGEIDEDDNDDAE